MEFWLYSPPVLRRFQLTAENFGLAVELVDEAWTSKTCALCGVRHRGG
ncbi:MAG: transposase [Candidatus Heimdallarchaeota archaeon]|nr:transposase [Candidatus Heimdallarchaeota archaeon]